MRCNERGQTAAKRRFYAAPVEAKRATYREELRNQEAASWLPLVKLLLHSLFASLLSPLTVARRALRLHPCGQQALPYDLLAHF